MKLITKDSWIALSLSVGFLLVGLVGWFIPQNNQLQDIRSQIAAQEVQLASDIHQSSVIPSIIQQIERMKQRYKGFDKRMPKSKELAGFLKEISGILASQQISNQIIEPGNPTREQLYHTLPIIMKFEGNYLSLARLLERIDQMQRLTRVNKLSISESDEENKLNIELHMNIYFTET